MSSRTIVTADPELDDLNSMIRLLLYSNEVRIEGLVYASSRFHWKGDAAGTEFFLPDREYSTPQKSLRPGGRRCKGTPTPSMPSKQVTSAT